MNEGVPKKEVVIPQEFVTEGELDTQKVFDRVNSIVDVLGSFPLPGDARRALTAFTAASKNLEYLLQNGMNHGAAFVVYLQTLERIAHNEEMWNALEPYIDVPTVTKVHDGLRTALSLLEPIQIDQFPFTGRIQ